VSTAMALVVFACSLAITLVAAAAFARRLDRLGPRLGLPEALVGLLTAAGADSPELATAVIAIATGSQTVGVGVVIGSNVFNLASMIGVSAVLTGSIVLRREALVLEGSVALLVAIVIATLLAGWIAAPVAVVFIVLVLVPYTVALSLGAGGIHRLPVPRSTLRRLHAALGESHQLDREAHVGGRVLVEALLTVPALAAIVLGSFGMVKAAISLADRWGLPRLVVGTIVLATLTSLPNAFTALRLALQRRANALVSETANSNTINLVGGLAIPALFVGLGSLGTLERFDVLWLLGMTLLTFVMLARPRGVGRSSGLLLVALYGVFVGVQAAAG
jgi:cation:H+ antiporter